MIFHSANKKKRKKKSKKKKKEGIKRIEKKKAHAIIVTWPYLSSMAKFFLNLMLLD